MLFNTLYILIFLLLLPFFLLKSCISKNFRKIFFYRLKASFLLPQIFFPKLFISKKFDFFARSLGGRGSIMANSKFHSSSPSQKI